MAMYIAQGLFFLVFLYNFLISIMQAGEIKKLSFKQANTLQQRKAIVQKSQKKNPNCIVLVIEKHQKYIDILPDLLHSRFIVNKSQTMLQLLQAVKDRLAIIDPRCKCQAVYLMVNNKMIDQHKKVVDLYELGRDKEDGILYVTYSNVDSF